LPITRIIGNGDFSNSKSRRHAPQKEQLQNFQPSPHSLLFNLVRAVGHPIHSIPFIRSSQTQENLLPYILGLK
jgi:hypothetical protein